MARKYGKKAQEKVEKVMHEYKEGDLKSGRSKKPVKSRKQAIAIALSEAREAGAKFPPAPKKKAAKGRKTAKKRKSTGGGSRPKARKPGAGTKPGRKTSKRLVRKGRQASPTHAAKRQSPLVAKTAKKVAKQPGAKKESRKNPPKGAR